MENVKSSATQPSPTAPPQSNTYDLQSCMQQFQRVSRLPEAALLEEFTVTLARDRGTTVDLLIQMGEIETRRLYIPRACPDMYTYCTSVLHMSESTASRRIRAARAARKFPVILPMVAEGALHLSAVSLLAPHLNRGNAAALLVEARFKRKAEVELIVARRFPRLDVPKAVHPVLPSNPGASPTAQVIANIAAQLSPVTVVPSTLQESSVSMEPLRAADESNAVHRVVAQVIDAAIAMNGLEAVPQAVLTSIATAVATTIVNAATSVGPDPAQPGESPARVTPRSAGRFAWQLTADQSMQDLLQEARELIGHAGPRDLAEVLKRGLELLVQTLRKSKYAETAKPRAQRAEATGRHVPAAIRRAVAERDGHQCTFEGPDGRRCSERSDLELDHIIPFARGGKTIVDNLRWLCGRHNQHEAERVFGSEHIQEQREASRARAGQARAAQRSRTNETAASRSHSGPSCGPDSSLDCAP